MFKGITVTEYFSSKLEYKKKNYIAYLKKKKIEILGLKILRIKIENSMYKYNNKLGTAEKKSVNLTRVISQKKLCGVI